MNSPTGFLYSQIGYDLGSPMQALVRGPEDSLPHEGAAFRLLDARDERMILGGPAQFWGTLWGSAWWIADFSALTEPGKYVLAIETPAGGERFRSDVISVGPRLLWEQTWRLVALDQSERRAKLAMNKVGWQDCGAAWQEANSHAALILGLCDLLEFAPERLSPSDRLRLEAQIVNGCDYLALLQDRAAALGKGEGAISHQTPTYDEIILASDTVQAAIAWARAARLLSASPDGTPPEYHRRAEAAFAWLKTARPSGELGFSRSNHGAPEDFQVPTDEWMTKDLLLQAWAAFELNKPDEAAVLASEILRRQVPKENPELGFYGHFRTFGSAEITEKAWAHHIGPDGPGADAGNHYPHWVLPLLRMCQTWPEHPQAERWETAVRDFAYGYFLPTSQASPFGIAPLGVFAGEGLLWFAGLWHGMNAVYGLTAAMALKLKRFFGNSAFRPIATSNLQWIAGLNAGVTADGMFASVVSSLDIPPDTALPCSMIHGIGARYAGSWLNLRGAICNGFSTGDQFVYDVAPTVANDGPHAFTDEDWITHAGAWISALARL